jgi:hypothetical protein
MIKSKGSENLGYSTGEINVYKILVGEPERKRPHMKYRRRWEKYINKTYKCGQDHGHHQNSFRGQPVFESYQL